MQAGRNLRVTNLTFAGQFFCAGLFARHMAGLRLRMRHRHVIYKSDQDDQAVYFNSKKIGLGVLVLENRIWSSSACNTREINPVVLFTASNI